MSVRGSSDFSQLAPDASFSTQLTPQTPSRVDPNRVDQSRAGQRRARMHEAAGLARSLAASRAPLSSSDSASSESVSSSKPLEGAPASPQTVAYQTTSEAVRSSKPGEAEDAARAASTAPKNVSLPQSPSKEAPKNSISLQQLNIRDRSDSTSSVSSEGSPPGSITGSATTTPVSSPPSTPKVAARSLSRLKSSIFSTSRRNVTQSPASQTPPTQTTTQTLSMNSGSVKDSIRLDDTGKITSIAQGVSWNKATAEEWSEIRSAIQQTVAMASENDTALLTTILAVAQNASTDQFLDVLKVFAEADVKSPKVAIEVNRLLEMGQKMVVPKVMAEIRTPSFHLTARQGDAGRVGSKAPSTQAIAQRYETVADGNQLRPTTLLKPFPLNIAANGALSIPDPPPTREALSESLQELDGNSYNSFLKNVEITLNNTTPPPDFTFVQMLAHASSDLDESRLMALNAVLAKRLEGSPKLEPGLHKQIEGLVKLTEKRIEHAWKNRAEELLKKAEKTSGKADFAEIVVELTSPGFREKGNLPGLTYPFTESQAIAKLAEIFSERGITGSIVQDFAVFQQERKLYELANNADATFALIALRLEASGLNFVHQSANKSVQTLEEKITPFLRQLDTVDPKTLVELERSINGIVTELKLYDELSPTELPEIQSRLEKVSVTKTQVLAKIISQAVSQIEQMASTQGKDAAQALQTAITDANWQPSTDMPTPKSEEISPEAQSVYKEKLKRQTLEMQILAPNGKITSESFKNFAKQRLEYLEKQDPKPNLELYDRAVHTIATQLLANHEIDTTSRNGIILMNELVALVTSLGAVTLTADDGVRYNMLNKPFDAGSDFLKLMGGGLDSATLQQAMKRSGPLSDADASLIEKLLGNVKVKIETKMNESLYEKDREVLLWQQELPETNEQKTLREASENRAKRQVEQAALLYGNGSITSHNLRNFFTHYKDTAPPDAKALVDTVQEIAQGYVTTTTKVDPMSDEGKKLIGQLTTLVGTLDWACQQDRQVIQSLNVQLSSLVAEVPDDIHLTKPSPAKLSTELLLVTSQISAISRSLALPKSYDDIKIVALMKSHPFTMKNAAELLHAPTL